MEGEGSTLDWRLVLRRLDDIQTEQRVIRQEIRGVREEAQSAGVLVLKNTDYVRRLDRRIGELVDDLEIIIKAEIGGRFAHLETRVEEALDRVADRVGTLEAGIRAP